VVVAAAETALERELSRSLMSGEGEFTRRTLDEGAVLVEQGSEVDDLYLLLDGVLGIEVDGEQIAEMGPRTMLGERAPLEGGVRTATVRALAPCRVVVVPWGFVAEGGLEALAAGRRREG
jgi:CRP-like cAMP-binding protein